MALKLKNNAMSLLSASITNSQTTLSITSGDEAKFPTLGTGDWHPITVYDSAGNIEVMKVTARAGITLTVVRAQEGSSAKAFDAGARVDIRVTASTLSDLDAKINGAVTKSLAGGDDVTASAADALNLFHHLTGTITDDVSYILPTASRIYVVDNATDGGFSVTIKTAAGTGVELRQGYRLIVTSDGTDIVPVSAPIARDNTILPDSVITKSIGLNQLSSAPTAASASGQFYTKEVTGRAEAFYLDSSGGETQLTKDGVLANTFAVGTSMLFAQSTAPLGWTKSTTHNDKALRVVSGTAGSGGTVDFTTAFASKSVSVSIAGTAITEAQMPAHTHTSFSDSQATGETGITSNTTPAKARSNQYSMANTGAAASVGLTSSKGGGQQHTHTATGTAINLAVKYVDVIIATKD